MKLLLLPILAASFFTLCACVPGAPPAQVESAPGKPSTATTAARPTYADPQHRFAVAIPAGMALRHDFQRSYLNNAAWKTFAAPDSQGSPAIALVLDGSNKITAAELRIGSSENDEAVANCLDVPQSGVPSNADTVNLAGTPFVHFRASDAAMSHYLDVESYRAVHSGRCYAIDLIVNGTRPEVYDPPATPPFTRAAARQKLHDALQGFRLQD